MKRYETYREPRGWSCSACGSRHVNVFVGDAAAHVRCLTCGCRAEQPGNWADDEPKPITWKRPVRTSTGIGL